MKGNSLRRRNSLRQLNGLAFVWALSLGLLLFISGCGQAKTSSVSSPDKPSTTESSQQTPVGSTNTPAPAEHLVKLTLYFPTPDADGLAKVERSVNVTDGAVVKAIFNELQNPPSGLDQVLPEGSKLLGATVKDGVATIDLSKEFQQNFNGGSTGERMIIYSIVDSLTSLDNVQSVQFLLEGKTQEAILGHLDTTKPLKRNESLIIQK